MVRDRAPTKQGLALGFLDGAEALPLQALEHRKRRRRLLTTLAIMPAPVRDRYLDEGDQKLGRRPSVIRFHHRARSLCRRRRGISTLAGTPRTPVRTRGDQREWGAGAGPADRLCQQPQG